MSILVTSVKIVFGLIISIVVGDWIFFGPLAQMQNIISFWVSAYFGAIAFTVWVLIAMRNKILIGLALPFAWFSSCFLSISVALLGGLLFSGVSGEAGYSLVMLFQIVSFPFILILYSILNFMNKLSPRLVIYTVLVLLFVTLVTFLLLDFIPAFLILEFIPVI